MFRIVCTLTLVAFFTAGCNTMAGLGRDIERTGEKIEQKAERNK
jgi:predicted small secreted protein